MQIDPTIPFLSPQKLKTSRYSDTTMLIAAQFTIVKSWK